MKYSAAVTRHRWLLAASVLAWAASGVSAQESASLRGRVTDTTGVPLAGALVEVAATYWRSTSGPDGLFVLAVPPGSWLVRVRKLGFSPETLTVSIPSAPIAIRLRVAPIELRAIAVTASQAPPLSSSVTGETVRQVPPLGEPDIFRAVVLLPGISQPNDLKGRIHLAGGASDETGVSLDGHPLQEPFHLLGVLGAFNVAALDRADVLIHHVPIDRDGGLSGLIDISSRRIGSKSESEVVVGILSAGITTVRPNVGGGIDMLGSVRTTYLDNLVERLGGQVRVRGDEVTLLGYRDGLLRVGKALSERTRAEALFFATRDNRRTAGSSASTSPFTWGEVLWGVRADHHGSKWILQGRGSFNRATAEKQPDRLTGFIPAEYVDLRRDWISASLSASRATERASVHLGASLDVRRTGQDWESRSTNLVPARAPYRFIGEQAQNLPSLFAESSRRSGAGVRVTGGMRAFILNGRTFLAPSIVLARELGPAADFELALQRRYQFVAELEEPEEGTGNQPLFLLAIPRKADVAAVSLSSRGGAGRESPRARWNVVAFAKHYRDRTRLVGDPRQHMDSTGRLPDVFPDFARVPGRSYGVALSGTRAVNSAALLQASYTFQRATERIEGEDSPVAWDAPHALNLFGSVQLRKKWIMNAVFQARSGAPGHLPGQRYSGRLSPYRRLDAGVRRQWRAKGVDWALSFQAINLLYRRNALAYDRTPSCVQPGECENSARVRRGLPIIPSITFDARW